MKPRLIGLSHVVLSLLLMALLTASSWNSSPSYDEPEHMTCGYTQVQQGSFWINPFHPPLLKQLSGYALSLQSWNRPEREWAYCGKIAAIQSFCFGMGNDLQAMTRTARAPMIALAGLFLLLYFQVLQRQLGSAESLTAGLALALSPTFLANAPLVHTDVGAMAACFVGVLLYLSGASPKHPRRWLLVTGCWLGIAMLCKYSCAVLAMFYALWRLPGRNFRSHLGQWLVLVALAVLVIWAQYALLPVPQRYQRSYNNIMHRNREEPVNRLILETQEVPGIRYLSWYLSGFYAQGHHLMQGHMGRSSYVRGRYFRGGRWDYFPTLWVSKECLATLLLVLSGGLGALLYRREAPQFVRVSAAFAALYLGIALLGNLNLGIRHTLPAYPFILAVVAWAWWNPLARVLGRPLVEGLLALWLLACSLAVYLAFPGYLSYFNELVGGKDGGPAIALDSNLDWGMDLYRLKLHMDEQGLAMVHLFYYGSNDPFAVLGPRYKVFGGEPLPPGQYLAVSLGYYHQAQLALRGSGIYPEQVKPSTLRWLLGLPEVCRIGDTLLLLKT